MRNRQKMGPIAREAADSLARAMKGTVRTENHFVETADMRSAIVGKKVVLVMEDYCVRDMDYGFIFGMTVETLNAAKESRCIGYHDFLASPQEVSGDILVLLSSRLFVHSDKMEEFAASLETVRRNNPGAAVVLHLLVEPQMGVVMGMAERGLADIVDWATVGVTDKELMLRGAEVLMRRGNGSLEKK